MAENILESNAQEVDEVNSNESTLNNPKFKKFVESKNELEKEAIILACKKDCLALLNNLDSGIKKSNKSSSGDLSKYLDKTVEQAEDGLNDFIESLPEDED